MTPTSSDSECSSTSSSSLGSSEEPDDTSITRLRPRFACGLGAAFDGSDVVRFILGFGFGLGLGLALAFEADFRAAGLGFDLFLVASGILSSESLSLASKSKVSVIMGVF
jgi:hypothetical protein